MPRLELTGTVQLDDVQTALVQPYVNRFVNAGLSGGALTLSAEVSHNPEQLLAAEGTLRYAAFEVQDRLREEKLAAWDSLQVDRFELNMADKTLATSEFKFGGLYGRVAIAEDLSTNVGDLLVSPPENANGTGDDGRRRRRRHAGFYRHDWWHCHAGNGPGFLRPLAAPAL